MLLPLVLGVAAIGPKMAETVSLQRTANVAVLLEDLSRRSGTPLTVGTKLGKEILIVAINDVPLLDAMNRIAWATFGIWEKSGGGYRLVRDTDAERAAERHYVKWQSGEAAATLGAYRARVLQRNVAPELNRYQLERQGRRVGGPPTPIERALAQALGFVRPETAVFTQPNVVAVYSNRPTAAEFPLGPGIQQVLDNYNAATPNGADAMYAVLTCRYVFERATASLSLFSDRGYLIGGTEATFPLYGPDSAPRAKEFADEVPPSEVPLSEASRFLIRDVNTINGFPDPRDISRLPDLTARLRDPERYEPMATFTTDVWRAVAASKGLNLVANVDDAYLFPGSWIAKTPTLGEAFRNSGGYNAELTKGWMIARPSLANAPWHHRIDRAALGRLARARPMNALSQFEAWADYAGAQTLPPDPWTTNMVLGWMGVPAPELFRGWTPARIFGSLTPQMRADWKSGRPLAIADITPASKQALAALIVSPYGRERDYQSFDDRPTALFPQGLPNEGVLEGGVETINGFNWRLPDSPSGRPFGWTSVRGIGDFVRRLESQQSDRLQGLQLQPVARLQMKLRATIRPTLTADIADFQEFAPTQAVFTYWNRMAPGIQDEIRRTGQ